MKLVEMKCKNCGSTLKVDENAKNVTCEYCHSSFAIDDEGREAFEKIADTIVRTQKSAKVGTFIGFIIFALIVFFGFRYFSKYSFNNTFEFHSGSQAKLFVESLIDDAVTNNKKNTKHVVTVKYNSINSTIPDEITKIKSSLKNGYKYNVSLNYGDDGYVNEITITEMGSEFEGFDDFTSTMDDMIDF